MYRDRLVKMLVIALTLVLLITACTENGQNQTYLSNRQAQGTGTGGEHKKVVLMILDSMTAELIDRGLEQDRFPALQFLIENGSYHKSFIAPYPSMSVTVESTLITGKMPNEHFVPGLAWYRQQDRQLINYGSSWQMFLRSGFDETALNTLYRLNHSHLNPAVSTIFEELESKGMSTGALNMLLYRGPKSHRFELPDLAESVDLPSSFEVQGPSLLSFGRFVQDREARLSPRGARIFQRFGLNDERTTLSAKQVLGQNNQPDFLMLFFPDFDDITHKHGPAQVDQFRAVEQNLQQLLNTYPSWEEALEQNIFIVMGDHGAVEIKEEEAEAGISLPRLFHEYRILQPGEKLEQQELAFAVNQRMTFVYDLQQRGLYPALAQEALQDERIAFISWMEDGWVRVVKPGLPSSLRFRQGSEWSDEYEQSWDLEGNPKALDLNLDFQQRKISFSDYPDALNQLYSALTSHEPQPLILEARPGHSFTAPGIAIHPGGSDHGGMHRQDTSAALIIAGTHRQPASNRMVDLKPFVLDLLTEPEAKKIRTQSREEKMRALQQQKKESEAPDKGEIREWSNVLKTAKSYTESIEGVQESVGVAFEQNIYLAAQVKGYDRFRLKRIRKEAFDLLRKRYPEYQIHVTTDWKVYRELERLEKKLKILKRKEIEQELKRVEEMLKG